MLLKRMNLCYRLGSAAARGLSLGRSMLKRLRVFAKEKRNVKLNQSLFPFIPAKAGIQRFWLWVPAFAGTNGTSIQRN